MYKLSKQHWHLEDDLVFLNHGSFGACPKEVLQKQIEIQQQLERSPVSFYLRSLTPALEEARKRLTSVVQCDAENLLFVPNASEGVSTVLHHIDWQEGDEIIISNHAYAACRHMLSVLRQKKGVHVKIAYTDFSYAQSTQLHTDYQDIVQAYEQQITSRTRCLFIEHISSPTAICFPVAALVALAKTYHLLSIVDAAHAVGQVQINLRQLQPDFYISNTHKWLFTPKSSAFLYIAPQHQDTFYPLVVSHGYLHDSPSKLHAMFAWTGTRDYSPYLCIPYALDWINTHCGSVNNLMTMNHRKLLQARSMLLDAWWPDQEEQALLNLPTSTYLADMCTIPVPPLRKIPTQELIAGPAGQIHPLQEYLFQHKIEVPVIVWSGGVSGDSSRQVNVSIQDPIICIRVSAQLYNQEDDYLRLIECVKQLR